MNYIIAFFFLSYTTGIIDPDSNQYCYWTTGIDDSILGVGYIHGVAAYINYDWSLDGKDRGDIRSDHETILGHLLEVMYTRYSQNPLIITLNNENVSK